MAYLLKEQFTLEGFTNKPFCLINKSAHSVQKLTAAQMSFLLGCDGSNRDAELTEKQKTMAQMFSAQGVISSVESQEAPAPQEPQASSAPQEPQASSSRQEPTRTIEYSQNDYPYRETAQLAITGRCNMRCRHCLAAADENNVSTMLSLEECKKVFADMLDVHIYNLWITGGEPMVHPQFKQIVQAATEYGLRFTRLFTNASLVTSETLDFLESCGQYPEFVVSFDGLGTHDWMRCCEGSEERTLAAIDLIRSRGFAVCGSVNVNNVTAPRVIETCRSLVFDHGCTSLHPIYTSPTPRWHKLAQSHELLKIADYYKLMIELLRVSRVEKWPAPLDIIHMPHLHLQPSAKAAEYLRNPPSPRDERFIMASCGRASNVVFIASDGRVLPCSTYEGETMEEGVMLGDDINIKKRSLKEIFISSEYADEHRINIAELREMEPGCRNCKWMQICCGGCPLYIRVRRFWDCGNPICELYKGGWALKYLNMLEETDDGVLRSCQN